MADLNAAIRDMLKSGMAEAEVVENLRQLGVGNPQEVFRKATQTLKPMAPPAAGSEAKDSLFSKPSPAATMAGDSDSKLDEALALLKALQETNKKILETNRDILLRLKS